MKKEDRYFQIKCPKCGHINTYDKNIVCKENHEIIKADKNGESDTLLLKCQNPKCEEKFTYITNCEGFK